MNDKLCPLLKKACLKHGCEFYINIMGMHPQTGVQTNEWGCTMTWLPILIIEGASKTRSVAAAVEDFRNKAVGVFGRIADTMTRRLDGDRGQTPTRESVGQGGGSQRPQLRADT